MTRPRITGSQIALDARIAWIQPGSASDGGRWTAAGDRARPARAGRSAARCPGAGGWRSRSRSPPPAPGRRPWRRGAPRTGRALALEPLPARRRASGLGREPQRPFGDDQLGARDGHAVPRHHDAHLDPVAGDHRVGAVRLRLGHRARRRPAAGRGPWSAWTRGRPRCWRPSCSIEKAVGTAPPASAPRHGRTTAQGRSRGAPKVYMACRITGRLAAPASSSRRTGVSYGALCATDGSSAASSQDRRDRLRELVERLARLGLGRLDQQRLVHQQREVDGRRVEVVVEQPLGEVERADPERLLHRPAGEHELVHAGAVERHRQVLAAQLAAAAPSGSWRSAPRCRSPRPARRRPASRM